MKSSILIIFSFLFFTVAFSQSITGDEFKKDVDFIYKNLQKSVSYKTQKENQKKVKKKYEELIQNIPTEIYGIEALEKFYQLIDEIKDYHNTISTKSKVYTYSELQERNNIDSILARSKGYFKITDVDLVIIENSLKDIDVNDIEGIYHLGKLLKVGVIQTPDKFIGIVLESQLPTWKRGEEIFYLIPKGDKKFRMITGSTIDKRLISFIDKHKGGTFRSSSWRKLNADIIFTPDKIDTAKYVYKRIKPSFSYLKISTFGTSNSSFKEAMSFYKTLKPKEFEKNLILDLRVNRGGGIRNSQHLYDILKQHHGNFLILTSYHTVSHGEQFVLKMKKLPNVKVLGERTFGMLTYGSNQGTNYNTPSGKYNLMFTDLKDNWNEYLKYEGIGIEPDIRLSDKSDWINQVLETIK